MRVGFLCSEYPGVVETHGGIGSSVSALAHGLVQAGHGARVYAVSGREERYLDGGVEVRLIPRSRSVILTILRVRSRLLRDLASGEVGVVESPECEAHLLPAGPGSIVRMNGSHHFWCATLGARPRPVRLVLEQIGVRQARGLCAVSEFAAETTRAAMRLGRRAIEVLPNPVDTDFFRPRPGSVVPGRVVFVGSVVEKKGVGELCQAIRLVRLDVPGVELLIAGRDCPAPSGGPSFSTEIREGLDRDTERVVRFLGNRCRDEVCRLMASAAVCVFPSYMETQGIVIAEAMACGSPVVVTNRGPGPEVIGKDGECGLLVDPASPSEIASAVVTILQAPERARVMGCRGRARAASGFGVKANLKRNLAFYRRHRRTPLARKRRVGAGSPGST